MSKGKGFDLAALDTISACNKPAEIEIKHPVTGEGTGVFFSVLGKDSDIVRGNLRAAAEEDLMAYAEGRRESRAQEGERKSIEQLIAATTGWRTQNGTGSQPVITMKGEQLEFSPENARRVYTAILPIRDQVSAAIFNLAHFMKG